MGMSATDELRRLLDERGVEWHEGHGDCDGHAGTLWDGIGGRWYAGCMTGTGKCRLYMETPADRAPEQVIEATLGRGTCTDVCAGVSEFTCSACGFDCDLMSWISLFDGDTGRHRHHHHGTPNYCPNCGRKVEA